MPHPLNLPGVICPMVTPFTDDGAVDTARISGLVDFLVERGVNGLMIGGTTGEGMLLDLPERKALLDAVVAHVAGRVPVIAHTGCISTAETIELTRHAAHAGASAISAVVPYFFTFDDASLFQHFLAVANAAPEHPILLYTFPGNAKNDISPDLLRRLLDATENIVGIKSSNPDLIRFGQYILTGGPEFVAICGVDGLMYPALACGAHGQISGNANAFPDVVVALYKAFRAGDHAQARQLQGTLDQIRAVVRDGLHPAYFKAVLEMRGVPAGRVRPPMRELTPEESADLTRRIRHLDLI